MAQFYVDGYRTGDPFVEDPHPAVAERPEGLPETADVVVVGCGPAGLVLAAQLANFPDLHTVVVDRQEGPLEVGQADGVACRTVEVFAAFGLADRLLAEGYRVNEVAFWRPDPADPSRIVRSGRVPDVEDDLSEMPHVIVNQARMLAYLRDHMERSAARLRPHHGLALVDLEVGEGDHPVTVTLAHREGGAETGATSTIRARYVVGCDGARSRTREAIGRRLVGDVTDVAWGVMDVLAVTDFPDIRLKCPVQSAEGSLLIIPREGGYLVRIYIELDAVRDADILRDGVTPEGLAAVAERILHPYTLDVREVAWWSVYRVGQRLCRSFDDADDDTDADTDADGSHPHVFIAGDACHTHSAKAGQGMNVSMADAWNLGWKLGTVLRGTARPGLLRTYTRERQAVARELIDFDREFSALFSGTARDADPEELQRYFRAQGRFTAGLGVRYAPSMITGEATHQHLAAGLEIGTRFHSAPVVRLADARPLHLGHVARADGAWRLFLFADRSHPSAPGCRLRTMCEHLPVARFTPAGAAPDAVVDVRAVLQQHHHEVSVADLPPALLPRKGRLGLVDLEKAFCPDPTGPDVFDLRGVDRDTGAAVLVRPDQYVAHVLPLDGYRALADALARVLHDAG